MRSSSTWQRGDQPRLFRLGYHRDPRRRQIHVVPAERRGSDFRIDCASDGETWRQMRICHLWEGGGPVSFGVYAASPENSCFKAVFTQMQLTECQWKAHDGQQPDEGCEG